MDQLLGGPQRSDAGP